MGFLDSLFGFLGSSDAGSSAGGGILNSGLSMLNAGLDSLGLSQHGRDQYFALSMQREFLEKQMEFQREMTANQQEFTREMYGQQWLDMLSKYPELQKRMSDIQFNNWRQQFNLQNEYNSYQNQVGRMLAAGINPNSIYGNGSVATSSMSGQGVSAPPSISPTPFGSNASPIGLPQGLSAHGRDISQLSSFVKDLADADLSRKKAGRYDEQVDAEIKKMFADAGLADSQQKYQELLTDIDKFYLPKEKASKVKLNLAEAYKAAWQGKEAEAHSKVDEALEELYKTQNQEAKARLPFVELNARAEIDEIHARAEEARAAADESRQRTLTETYNTRIAEIRADTDAKTQFSKITTMLSNMRKERVLNDAQMKEARLKAKRIQDILNRRENGLAMKYVDEFLTWLTGHIGVAINGSLSSSSSSVSHD